MRTRMKQMMGLAAVCATMGLAPAAFASSSATAPKSIEVNGQIEHLKVDTQNHGAISMLGLVTPEGQVYLLLPTKASKTAFNTAERLAGRDDWATVSGVLGRRDGYSALEVGEVTKR